MRSFDSADNRRRVTHDGPTKAIASTGAAPGHDASTTITRAVPTRRMSRTARSTDAWSAHSKRSTRIATGRSFAACARPRPSAAPRSGSSAVSPPVRMVCAICLSGPSAICSMSGSSTLAMRPNGRAPTEWPLPRSTSMSSASSAAISSSSRVLPIPASPIIKAIAPSGPVLERVAADRSVAISSSRPMSGALSTRACFASSSESSRSRRNACTGRSFPFIWYWPMSVSRNWCRMRRAVSAETNVCVFTALSIKRAAVFTVSPMTPNCVPSPTVPAMTRPVLMPMCISSGGRSGRRAARSSRAACISIAARAARSGSSSCEIGAPKIAQIASPMNFST